MTQPITSKELADTFIQDQEDRHKDPDKYRGYRFPMNWLMKHTGGFGRDWIIFVYAKSGVGKTSFLTTAATQFGKDNLNFLYVSMEEGLFTVAQRVFSNLEDINRTKFRDIKLTQADWPNVYTAAQTLSSFQGHWTHGIYSQKEIVDAVKTVKPQAVILDYLQLMEMPGKSFTEQMAKASKFVTKLARGGFTGGQGMTVICAAQLNDDGEVLYSRDPDRDSDLTLKIETIDNGAGDILPDRRMLTIKKFRHGETASTHMAFFGGRSLVGQIANPKNVGPIPQP